MKTLAKNIGKLLTVVLFTTFGVVAKAQTHVKAAANCLLHDAYVKEASKTKNAVSCVDCYCKVCGDKKANEKEAKNKARELADKQHAEKQKLADEKARAEQKKKAEIERAKAIQKAKDNEAILVAPKPSGKSTVVKLSADDQKIMDAAKKIETAGGDDLSFRSVGPNIRKGNRDNTITLTLFAPTGYTYTILREDFVIKSSFPYNEAFGMVGVSDKESFQNTGLYVVKLKTYSDIWYDLADIQGNCVFNDKDIKDITYKGANKEYIIVKRKKDDTTGKWLPETKEAYNPTTKKTTPIQ